MNATLQKAAARPGRRRWGRGFTIVELLVVIAVIVIIAVLLLPALARAKEKAQRLRCLSLQKQWALAFLSYVDDHENMIPREGYERFGDVRMNNWIQVKGIRRPPAMTTDSDDVWYNALAEYVGARPASEYASPDKRAGFYGAGSLFHCPAAKFPRQTDDAKHIMAYFSLAMNSQLIEFPYGPSINFDRLREEESRIVLFLDNRLEDEAKVHPAQENSDLGQPAAYADRFSARHGGGGNLAFADGHVTWFPGRKVVETNPESPLRGGPILPPVDIVWEPKYDF